MQDRSPPVRRNPLATHGRTIHVGHLRLSVRSIISSHNAQFVNTPPPKGGGFRLRLKAGSVRPAADSGNGKIVVRLRRRLVLDVFRPDLIGDVATARNPISPCP